MQIPERDYTTKEFIQYIQENPDEVFLDEIRRHWIKIYSLLVSNESWKTSLFSSDELNELGEVYKATLQQTEEEEETTYYIIEYTKGLLLLFTSAKKEDYKNTLQKRIEHTRGVTRMWIKPDLFKYFWQSVIRSTGGYVYNFRSIRSPNSEFECQLRPNYRRRFNYSGYDGKEVMEELQELYGVTPDSVKIRVNPHLKVHLTNKGLFSAQKPSFEAFSIFFDYLNKVLEKIMKIKEISQELKFDFIEGPGSLSHMKFPSVVYGAVKFSIELNKEVSEKLMESTKDFSFVDCDIQTGSLKFTATVIDENKDSVFNISANESEMYLIPKYRTTFESLYNFYELITEEIDKEAELSSIN